MEDYFQNVVVEFLGAHRSTFVNSECCIQLDPGKEALKGRYWICDAIAADFQDKTVYLCEVTYARSLQSLVRRLVEWNKVWPQIRAAISRDCSIPDKWNVCPWAFVPEELADKLKTKLAAVGIAENGQDSMPYPKVTTLEDVVPWKENSRDKRQRGGDGKDA